MSIFNFLEVDFQHYKKYVQSTTDLEIYNEQNVNVFEQTYSSYVYTIATAVNIDTCASTRTRLELLARTLLWLAACLHAWNSLQARVIGGRTMDMWEFIFKDNLQYICTYIKSIYRFPVWSGIAFCNLTLICLIYRALELFRLPDS